MSKGTTEPPVASSSCRSIKNVIRVTWKKRGWAGKLPPQETSIHLFVICCCNRRHHPKSDLQTGVRQEKWGKKWKSATVKLRVVASLSIKGFQTDVTGRAVMLPFQNPTFGRFLFDFLHVRMDFQISVFSHLHPGTHHPPLTSTKPTPNTFLTPFKPTLTFSNWPNPLRPNHIWTYNYGPEAKHLKERHSPKN